MAELLRVENLSAGYGEARVVHDVSFGLEDGQSLALLGRNGVGKTTVIDLLIGVTTRFGGRIALAGEDIAPLPPYRRARRGVGWAPQERNIFRSLTVEENLTAVAIAGPWTVKRVYALFPRLRERRGLMGRQLSGGEQQMLAIGRALVVNRAPLPARRTDRGLGADHRRRIAGGFARTRPRGLVDDRRRAEAQEDLTLHGPRDRARSRRDRVRRAKRRASRRPVRARRISDRDKESPTIGRPYRGALSQGDGTPTRMSREKSGD